MDSKKEPGVERPLKNDDKPLLRLYRNLKRLNRKAQALREPETPKKKQVRGVAVLSFILIRFFALALVLALKYWLI